MIARLTLVLILAAPSVGGFLEAQESAWDMPGAEATRASLEQLLARFENGANSRAYSEELRARARRVAATIQARLEEGDFQVGDRLVITVEGELELSDTFVVASDRVLALPVVGEVPLRGVLRSEIREYLTQQVGRFITDPVVHARSLVRISIVGEVGFPGFHLFPVETPVTEALMAVGGPTRQADMNKVRVDRGSTRILEGEQFQAAIREGQTLHELQLQAGDAIVVPRRSPFAPGEIGRTALLILGVLWTLSRIF